MEKRNLLAQRMADIITKLNLGESLCIESLAEEFNVSKRTIQRDINSRLAFLPLERSGNKISLNSSALGKLNHQDIQNFAQLSGVSELFPELDRHFITSLLSNAFDNPYLITGNEFEHYNNQLNDNIKKLELAVNKTQLITFKYKDKQYNNVSPYKLINHNQVWYLAAMDNEKLKTFHIAELKGVFQLNITFKPQNSIVELINKSNDIYIAEPTEKFEVVLKVSPQVAHYFKRRNLLPEQIIDKELENGELIVSSRVAYNMQIIPLIKYWIPHLQVISPQEITQIILKDIEEFKRT